MIRNKNIFPNGGWVYRERIAKTYLNISDMGLGFDAVVRLISKARSNNPGSGLSAAYEKCAEALEAYTCKRLNYDARWCVTADNQKVAIATKRKCAGCGAKKKKK